uniref:Uncharacterized protein n=1 Tax=Rangifer tarandus platyrhynchus TaxID=3082113 RepID=A0ACB0EX85_RANTA|nr:unnamed protein product [Rangifer tarandus platyrhynchus]
MTPSASSLPPPPGSSGLVRRCVFGRQQAGRRERNRDRGRRGRDHAQAGRNPSRDEEVPLTALSRRPRRSGMTYAWEARSRREDCSSGAALSAR